MLTLFMHDATKSLHTQDPIAELLKKCAQNILVVVFGLLPIFFLPIETLPSEYTKILFVSGGVFVALIFYSLSALRAGGITLGTSLVPVLAWVVALAALASALLGGDASDSLIGETMGTHTTAFLLLVALSTSVWSFVDSGKREVMRLYTLFSVSALVLVAFHVCRMVFGADSLSLGVFTSPTASPVGSWNDLALFLGLTVILAIVTLEQLSLSASGKGFFVAVVLLSLIMLGLINFFVIWLVLGFTSLTIVVYALTKERGSGIQSLPAAKKSFNSISFLGSLVVFVVSVVFIVGGSVLGASLSSLTGISYVEVRPSFDATINLARSVYDESPFLGVGPNKFVDAWRQYKDTAINTTVFWNTDFTAGHGYLTTFLVTSGAIGFLAWVAFLVTFVVSGVRMLFRGNDHDRMWYFIGVSSFVGGLYIWGMSLVYVPGAVMLMLGAIFVGVTVTADRALRNAPLKSFSMVTDKRTGFVFTLIVIAVIIGSVSGLYGIGKHYASAQAYTEGMNAYAQGDVTAALAHFERSYALYASDLPLRRVGELELARLNMMLTKDVLTETEELDFRAIVQNGIAVTEKARSIDPSDAENWAIIGDFYSLLAGLNIEGAYEKSKEAFTQSRMLHPSNPRMALSLGILEGKMGRYEDARVLTLDAIRLKSNFTDAYYHLSQLDIVTGNVSGAISNTRSIISLEPSNPVRYYQLGILEASQNNLPAAIAAFEQAISRDPNYANAHYMLALTYEESDRLEDARIAFGKVLELNPGNQDVEARLQSLGAGTNTTKVDEAPVQPLLSDDRVQSEGDGTVTTKGDPNTDLVAPVNTVPESEVE